MYLYLEEHKSQCQFFLKDLRKDIEGECPDWKTVQIKLNAAFPKQLYFTKVDGQHAFFFINKIDSTKWDFWFKSRNKDEKVERKRIVEMAAKIILEDISKLKYNTDFYEWLDDTDEESWFKDLVPESLRSFLDYLDNLRESNLSRKLFETLNRASKLRICKVNKRFPCRANMSIQEAWTAALAFLKTDDTIREWLDSDENDSDIQTIADATLKDWRTILEYEGFDVRRVIRSVIASHNKWMIENPTEASVVTMRVVAPDGSISTIEYSYREKLTKDIHFLISLFALRGCSWKKIKIKMRKLSLNGKKESRQWLIL